MATGDRIYIGGGVGATTSTPPEDNSVMTNSGWSTPDVGSGNVLTETGWQPLSAATLVGTVNNTKYKIIVDDTDATNPQFGIEEIA